MNAVLVPWRYLVPQLGGANREVRESREYSTTEALAAKDPEVTIFVT
jgi:hypothetical protein